MPSVQRRRSAGRGAGWSVVVLRAGERLGASWSADVSACAVCICGHKSPRRRLCVTELHVHVCANERSTGDPTGPRTGVRDTIQGSTDHATRDGARRRRGRDRPENRRGIYRRTRECTPPRRTSGSAAATARTLRGIERVAVRRDETTFTCFTNGNLSGLVHVHAGSTHIPCGRPQRDLAEISPVACTARPQ